MAWFVLCSTFSAPLFPPSTPKTLIQDAYPKRLIRRRLLGLATLKTVVKVSGCKCFFGSSMYPEPTIFHHRKTTGRIHFCEPFPCNFNVSSGNYTLLSGFWVGPDIDDGWGFVEALVNRLF